MNSKWSSRWNILYTPDDLIVNEYFHDVHRKANLPSKGNLYDILNQTLYVKDPGVFRSMEKLVFLYMSCYTKVKPIHPVEYLTTMEKIFETLKTGSVLFFCDHKTYASLLLMVWELVRRGETHWSPEVKDRLYTILWPLLTTHKKYVGRFSHITHALKTIPETNNIPKNLSEDAVKKQRKIFARELTLVLNTPWNAVIMAPAWWTDAMQRSDEGKLEQVSFVNDEAVQTSIHLAEKRLCKWDMVVFASIDDSQLKHPFVVPYRAWKWVPGNTSINMKIANKDEFIALKKEGKVMDMLASLVQNPDGKQIWRTLPRHEFEELKKNMDTSHLLGKDWAPEFDDTLMKKFLRKIFEAVLK